MAQTVTSPKQKEVPECMPLFCLILKFCCFARFIPYQWDRRRKILKTCNRSSYILFWIFGIGNTAIKVGYLGARFVYLYIWPTEEMIKDSKAYSSVLFSSWSVFAIKAIFLAGPLNLYVNMEGAKKTLNYMLEARRQRPKLLKDTIVTKVMFVIYIFRIYQLLMSTLSRKSPDFMYRLLPEYLQNQWTFWIYAIWSSFECLTCYVCPIHLLGTVIYLNTMKQLLKEGLGPHSTIKEALITYKSYWILSNTHQESFSAFYMLWMTLYCTVVMILCTFGTLHFYGRISSSVYFSMPISMAAIVAFSCYYYTQAGKHSGYFAKAARRRFQNFSAGQLWMKTEVRDISASDRNNLNNAKATRSSSKGIVTDDVTRMVYSTNMSTKRSNVLKAELQATFKSCKAPLITLGSTFPMGRSQILKLTSFVLIQTMRMLILAGSIPREASESSLE